MNTDDYLIHGLRRACGCAAALEECERCHPEAFCMHGVLLDDALAGGCSECSALTDDFTEED